MKTKNYTIRITGSDQEHTIARKRIEEVFADLNRHLLADMEIYIQTIEPRNSKFYLYGLERKVLTNTL